MSSEEIKVSCKIVFKPDKTLVDKWQTNTLENISKVLVFRNGIPIIEIDPLINSPTEIGVGTLNVIPSAANQWHDPIEDAAVIRIEQILDEVKRRVNLARQAREQEFQTQQARTEADANHRLAQQIENFLPPTKKSTSAQRSEE